MRSEVTAKITTSASVTHVRTASPLFYARQRALYLLRKILHA